MKVQVSLAFYSAFVLGTIWGISLGFLFRGWLHEWRIERAVHGADASPQPLTLCRQAMHSLTQKMQKTQSQ